jgi:nucleoside-diphosphate-sugar epimerase
MKRDFTYVDDIVEAIIRMQDVIPQADPNWTVESGSRPPAQRLTISTTSAIAHRWS